MTAPVASLNQAARVIAAVCGGDPARISERARCFLNSGLVASQQDRPGCWHRLSSRSVIEIACFLRLRAATADREKWACAAPLVREWASGKHPRAIAIAIGTTAAGHWKARMLDRPDEATLLEIVVGLPAAEALLARLAQPLLPGRRPALHGKAVGRYLAHTRDGIAMREIARREGCHASTILRSVRAVEAWRDDPAFDSALATIKHGRTT